MWQAAGGFAEEHTEIFMMTGEKQQHQRIIGVQCETEFVGLDTSVSKRVFKKDSMASG